MTLANAGRAHPTGAVGCVVHRVDPWLSWIDAFSKAPAISGREQRGRARPVVPGPEVDIDVAAGRVVAARQFSRTESTGEFLSGVDSCFPLKADPLTVLADMSRGKHESTSERNLPVLFILENCRAVVADTCRHAALVHSRTVPDARTLHRAAALARLEVAVGREGLFTDFAPVDTLINLLTPSLL